MAGGVEQYRQMVAAAVAENAAGSRIGSAQAQTAGWWPRARWCCNCYVAANWTGLAPDHLVVGAAAVARHIADSSGRPPAADAAPPQPLRCLGVL